MSEKTENLLGTLSLLISDQIRSQTTAEVSAGGGSPAALVALASFLGGGTNEELRSVLGLSHSATVRLVEKLEDRALIERGPGADARSVSIKPTAAGVDLAERVLERRADVLRRALHPLSAGERKTLKELLAKVLAAQVGEQNPPRRICRLCDIEACGHHRGECPVTEANRRDR